MTKETSNNRLTKALDTMGNAIPQNQVQTGVDPYKKAQSYLKAMAPAIQEALPKSSAMNPERMSRLILTTLRTSPKLLECSIESLLGACLQASSLGLDPSLLGSCYFIPYKNTVSFQIGYKGLIDLVTRKGDCLNIVAQEVCEHDEFFYEFGRNENLKHVPSTGNRGKPKFYYAYANLKNGGFVFQVMSIEEIERIRDMYSIGYKFDKTGSIWAKNFDSMALKTVIKRLIKYMPISVETASAIQFDETVRKDISSEPEFVQPDIIDMPKLEVVSEGGELNA